MAVYKPVRYDSVELTFKTLSDTDLEVLSYAVRKKYAQLLNTDSTIGGTISVGTASNTSYVSIGSATDSKTTTTTQTQADNTTGGAPGPGTGADNIFPTTLSSAYHVKEYTNTTNFRQYRSIVPTISSATFDSDSYLYYDDTLQGLKFENNITNIFDTIINDCVTQMQTGDKVGSQFFSTSSPTGGVFSDKGIIFQDTTYHNTTIDFRKYIKLEDDNDTTILSNPSAYKFITRYEGITDGNCRLIEVPFNDTNNALVVNILVKILEKRFPIYSLVRVGSQDSATDSSTTVANYTGQNFGFLYERFVQGGYTITSTSGVSGGTYTGFYAPDNNTYRYNVWALIPNGYNTVDL